ncbi:MAG: voltage-gated chloride channel ClcB [Curvibacter sp.]|nr:MAG: voltage-gated chloride channel ClcB [Curvibacter sp.]
MKHLAFRWLTVRAGLQRFFRIAEWQWMLGWAVVAGVLGALATESFRWSLQRLDHLLLGQGGSLVALARSLPAWERVLVPTLGGVLAGVLLMLARRAANPQAHSDYMEATVLGDGRIPLKSSLLRSASSLLSIASGGSIGREGSMVQLAALSASLLGQGLRFPVARLRLLVACGAAAGITAAYSAPIAGTFFVAEIVLGSMAMESLGPIMVAAVVANIVMRQMPGYQPPYAMPPFPAVAGIEVLLFALMGLVLGAGAALFLRLLGQARSLFGRLPVALPWRLALGGLLVGLISVPLPEVWGNGYSVVNSVLHADWPWALLMLLLVAKVVATLCTVGSGAVGGVFTPAIFFGCLVGALFGQGAQALWPQATSAPLAYAMVGMGAFLAGATQAPLMAILMIFEMTLSYQVMLPLMVASVIAYFVARSVHAGAMYDITSRRQSWQAEQQRLRALGVRELIEPALTVVGLQAGLDEMSRLFLHHPVKYLYVVNDAQHFQGVVPLKRLSPAERLPDLERLRAADLLSAELLPLTADMGLTAALQRFMEHRGERLPVIASQDDPRLLGVVNKSALLATYARLSG